MMKTLLWGLLSLMLVLCSASPSSAQSDLKVNDIAWRPDGLLLAAGTDEGVILFDKQMHQVQSLPGLDRRVQSVAWSPDSMVIMAAVSSIVFNYEFLTDDALFVWNYDAPSDTYILNQQIDYDFPNVARLQSIAWSPTGQTLAVVEERWAGVPSDLTDDFIVLWDTTSWQRTNIKFPHVYRELEKVVWSGDGRFVAGRAIQICSTVDPTTICDSSEKSGVFVADALTGERKAFERGVAGKEDMDWFGNNRLAAVAGDMVFYDVLSDGSLTNIQAFRDVEPGQSGYYLQVEWLDDGVHALVLYDHAALHLVNTQTLETQFLTYLDVYQMDLNPDQHTLAFFTGAGSLSIADVRSSD